MEKTKSEIELKEKKKTHRIIGFLIALTIVLVILLVLEIAVTISKLFS